MLLRKSPKKIPPICFSKPCYLSHPRIHHDSTINLTRVDCYRPMKTIFNHPKELFVAQNCCPEPILSLFISSPHDLVQPPFWVESPFLKQRNRKTWFQSSFCRNHHESDTISTVQEASKISRSGSVQKSPGPLFFPFQKPQILHFPLKICIFSRCPG